MLTGHLCFVSLLFQVAGTTSHESLRFGIQAMITLSATYTYIQMLHSHLTQSLAIAVVSVSVSVSVGAQTPPPFESIQQRREAVE